MSSMPWNMGDKRLMTRDEIQKFWDGAERTAKLGEDSRRRWDNILEIEKRLAQPVDVRPTPARDRSELPTEPA